MVKINFIVLFFIFLSPIVCAQRVVVSDSVVFSGVVFDTQDSQTLPNVTFVMVKVKQLFPIKWDALC